MPNALVFVEKFENKNILRFVDCVFDGGLYFSAETATTFSNDLEFWRCSFSKELDLSGCKFQNESHLMLMDTRLPDMLNLSKIKIDTRIDLTNALPNKKQKCYINLWNADFKAIRMQYRYFYLYFPSEILNDENNNDKISQTYEQVLAKYCHTR